MTRRAVAFRCGADTLWGMRDCAHVHGHTGLLIVSGGNEIRAGAFAGQAQIAARLAQTAGVPVFRFDRRGIGDSEGDNAGWRGSRDDLAAALAAFRREQPSMHRVVGYGVCDAASALMLHSADLGLDAVVLVNPWTMDEHVDNGAINHAPAALRQRYWAKLASPHQWWRLLSGQVNLARLWHGLGRAVRRQGAPSLLADQLRDSLGQFHGPVTLLVAAGDRIGQQFLAQWPHDDPRLVIHPGGSHSFTDHPDTADWLIERLTEATASRH
ncbi:hydrolase 1, exosortase A system-associated [Novosphingobium sp.]|uniref:hydrolase 1, exosortase A system-associated n=1 Tax=Novosphingobium sp. TaxID=1874826 RepID=UPI00333E19F3